MVLRWVCGMRSVIPKVEPRLQGFKLKEIFFKHVQINEIKRKLSWYKIKAIGKITQLSIHYAGIS